MSYDIKKAKVLVATPNYTNTFSSEVYASHIECVRAWTQAGLDFNMMVVGRTFVHFARTQACDVALRGGYTHVFWLDDDAVVEPDILTRFIQHDKDIVVAPYPMRRAPHEIGCLVSTVGDFHQHETYRNLTVADLDQGLMEIDGGGTHAMLVKTSVLTMKPEDVADAPDPYPTGLKELLDDLTEEQRKQIDHFVGDLPDETFSLQEENDDLGKPYFMMPKSGTEDMYFCYRAKKKGATIWCDTDVFAGHVGFYPVVGRSSTEYYESLQAQTAENRGGVAVLPVLQGGARDGAESDNGDDGQRNDAESMPGLRRNAVDTSKTSSLV